MLITSCVPGMVWAPSCAVFPKVTLRSGLLLPFHRWKHWVQRHIVMCPKRSQDPKPDLTSGSRLSCWPFLWGSHWPSTPCQWCSALPWLCSFLCKEPFFLFCFLLSLRIQCSSHSCPQLSPAQGASPFCSLSFSDSFRLIFYQAWHLVLGRLCLKYFIYF